MKTSDRIHENKRIILDEANSLYFKHGNGFDMRISVALNAVTVSFYDFQRGYVVKKGVANFRPAQESAENTQKIAQITLAKALREAGAKFTLMSELA